MSGLQGELHWTTNFLTNCVYHYIMMFFMFLGGLISKMALKIS